MKPATVADALVLLRQLAGPCEDTGEHAWRTCKRCLAIHALEFRFDLTMRLLNVAIETLQSERTERS